MRDIQLRTRRVSDDADRSRSFCRFPLEPIGYKRHKKSCSKQDQSYRYSDKPQSIWLSCQGRDCSMRRNSAANCFTTCALMVFWSFDLYPSHEPCGIESTSSAAAIPLAPLHPGKAKSDCRAATPFRVAPSTLD